MNIMQLFCIMLIDNSWGLIFFVFTVMARGKALEFLFKLKKFMKTELPKTKIHYIQESFKHINEKKKSSLLLRKWGKNG